MTASSALRATQLLQGATSNTGFMCHSMLILHAACKPAKRSVYLKSRNCNGIHNVWPACTKGLKEQMLTLSRSSQHSKACCQGMEGRLSLRLFTNPTSTGFCRYSSVLCEIYHNLGCPARSLFLEASYRCGSKHQPLSHSDRKRLQHSPQGSMRYKVAAKRQTRSAMQQLSSNNSHSIATASITVHICTLHACTTFAA